MNGSWNLGYDVFEYDVYDTEPPISKVRLYWDEQNAFEAGDDTGTTLEIDCPYATQAMCDNLLARAKGYVYRGYRATGAILPDDAELGDSVGVAGDYGLLANIVYGFDPDNSAEISAPGEKEVTSEYKGSMEQSVANKVTLGAAYYGTRISRAKGLEIVSVDEGGTEHSRVQLNSDTLAFYNDTGEEALYFDAAAGKFKFTGLLNVADNFLVDADGNVTVNGNINLSGGTITWGVNEPDSGISASRCRTIIGEELVSSPNIAGGKFWDLGQENWIEMGATSVGRIAYLNHYYSGYSDTDPVCVMGYTNNTGAYPTWVLAPFFNIALEYSERDKTMHMNGDWDFSMATLYNLETVESYEFTMDTAENITFRTGDGNVILNLDNEHNRINFYFESEGVTWFLDADGLHR